MDHEYYELRDSESPRPVWFINYDADRALQNHAFLSATCGREADIHVSRDCSAIIVCTVALAEISEPHVMAWRDSFMKVDRKTLAARAVASDADLAA